MHLERNATWGFAFGDRCFGPFCDSLLGHRNLLRRIPDARRGLDDRREPAIRRSRRRMRTGQGFSRKLSTTRLVVTNQKRDMT